MENYSYQELKNNSEKVKEFKRKLPWNFASFLYKQYLYIASKNKQPKPKYSISTIRKVANGERHNEEVMRDLIEIANQYERINEFKSALNQV